MALGSVSIPNRDFGELQFSTYANIIKLILFQSLIGILVNCNSAYTRTATNSISFNP